MKIIRSKYIPFQGYKAINLFGVLFVRGNAKISEVTLNHEKIHTAQIKEMLYIFFYLWYVIEWFIRLFMIGNAYRNISFEREAYDNEDNILYLDNRKRFAWIKHLKTNTINMNITEIIATTVGIIGSIGGIGTLIYWRQNKLGSTSDALSKAFDALEKVTNLVDDQQEKHNKQMSQKDVVIEQLYQVIDQKTQVALDNQTKIDKLTREWKERDYEFATMKRQIKTMQNIINDFEARAKHAENNICQVTGCELRVPKLGTYKPK